MTYQAPSQPPVGYYPQAPQPPTNTMAIIAIVAAFLFAPAGIVCGHIARKQIKQTGEQGDGMALAGIVIGWCVVGCVVVLVLFWLLMFGLMAAIFTSVPWDTLPSGTPAPAPSPFPTA